MGKPTNKPRVKGNLKPASSSRAAELTGATHSLSFDNLGGFAQFAGAIPATTAGIVSGSRPSTPSSFEGFDSSSPFPSAADLDSELVFILKKLSKRDVTTKLKALEELQAYLQNNEKVIGSIMHTWVGVYSKMTLEVDRRIRLAANEVNSLVTANAKKKLAPVLKDLIGPWLLSMYDQSKDIVQVARTTFESVFALEKRLPAISFCQKEILHYVTDMLLYKTADTLSDPRYVSKEDMMAKYARVISSSLQILSYLITSLSAEERSKCQQEYMIILDDTTMWKKFASHENGLIRRSLYGFLKTLLLSWTDMVESRMDLICPSFFTSVFKETDASTHSEMWDAVLLMTKKLPSSWIVIGKKKPALPKLYNFLRSGLHGSPNIAYPSLLALLANLPKELKSTPNFYNDIFENFWKGLSTEYIDRNNSHVFLNAYAECIVYFVITLSKSDEESAAQIANTLVTNTFWEMIKIYFLNSRDKVISEKLDPNSGYAIIAKHFTVLATIDNVIVKDCMPTLYSNMDDLFVQTIVDCGSVTTRAPLDMNVFCQKTGDFLTAIAHELSNIKSSNKNNNDEKGKMLEQVVDDLSKRLLVASVESSIVHKEQSVGLLLLASKIIHADTTALSMRDLNKLLHASRQLLDSLVDGELDNLSTHFVSYYIALIARLKKSSKETEATKLWLALPEKLKETYHTNDEPTLLKGATVLSLVWKQLAAEKVALSVDDDCEALSEIIDISMKKLKEETISDKSRQFLENTVASTLSYRLSSNNLPASTTKSMIETIHSSLITFNHYHYADESTFTVSKPSLAISTATLSAFKILNSMIDNSTSKKEMLQSLLANDMSNALCGEIFDTMFTAEAIIRSTPVVEEDGIHEDEHLLEQISEQASSLWQFISDSQILQNAEKQQQHMIVRVRNSISDIYYTASPSDSVQRIKKLLMATTNNATTWSALLGIEKEWIQLNARLFGQQYTTDYLQLGIVNHYATASVEPLVDDSGELSPVKYDIYGLSAFGRLALTWCEYLASAEGTNLFTKDAGYDWVIRQIMLASISCEQGLSVPKLSRFICNAKAVEGIRVFVQRTSQQLFSDWLTELATNITDIGGWNDQLLKTVTAKQQTDSDDRLLAFIAQLLNQKQEGSNHCMVGESAALLQHLLQKLVVLGDWQAEHLEKWLPCIKPESNDLDLLIKMAILTAFKDRLSQSDAYQHYQSDLASKMSGITASQGLQQFDFSIEDPDLKRKLNWSILSLLNASAAPKTNSIDIPKQRLTYLIQALRPLLAKDSATDENVDEDDFSNFYQKAKIQAQLAELLKHLAISVADVQGGHWKWFVQCCFDWTAFRNTTSQPEELLLVYHALDLFRTLVDLSQVRKEQQSMLQNEELHDVVAEHGRSLSRSLLQLMAKEQEYIRELQHEDETEIEVTLSEPNKARLTYQTVLSDLLEHIPEDVLFDDEYFYNFQALIHTPNEVLQKRAYLLLKKYIAHKTQNLSVQLEFTETSEEEIEANLPVEILETSLNPPEVAPGDIEEQLTNNVFAYLLTWMLMFDHFTDITFRLKQEYTRQLKEKEAVSQLMPLLCKILNIGINSSSAKKAFDLTPWSVLDYNIESFDASVDTSFSLLAGHLYYRALTHIPSLIRQWWIDCKNRQLTIAVENYTEKHFSQLLIQHELDLVNRPDIKSQLEEKEENEFNVKTLKGANEVTATYKVDEQSMQIAIKLPSNFPLRQIDVEGIQKVGVNDKQWRGWMFAVAAVISSQNGNIVDALTVFKRNVNLHFNGVEDCTICYSIISVQDRSIPTKQCRTCKNKFHSSCLYKWFRSSNSASCPLCRTVF